MIDGVIINMGGSWAQITVVGLFVFLINFTTTKLSANINGANLGRPTGYTQGCN